MEGLTVAVLGPLEVAVDGRPVQVTAGRLRTLLVALALSSGAPLSLDALAARIWPDGHLPEHPRRSVQTYVARLRAALGEHRVETSSTGALSLPDADVDALRFEHLVGRSSAAGARERSLLVEALNLWRGEPFEDVPGDWLERVEAPRLVELRLAALERRIDLDIASGRLDGLVAEISEWTARHPLRESLWLRWLAVLDRSGRPAEALRQYERVRRHLAAELGTDPGADLQRAHADLLAGRRVAPDLDGAPAGTRGLDRPGRGADATPTAAEAITVIPRQLPAPPTAFVGRTAELAVVDGIDDPSTVVITTIDGMAGVGKTAFAVHVAHRLVGHYPDGQLYLDLHGHSEGIPRVEPGDALDRMLRALGVPDEQIPEHLDDRAALYRDRLAYRKVLVVLDNAADEEQVAPLLPGGPGSLVVITSRRRLTALDRTHSIQLDLLPVHDAITLLGRAAGPGRLDGEPPQLVEEAVELCGRLPLAIRIAAGRLRAHPNWDLAHLISRLRDRQRRLDQLEAGSRSAASALDLSYDQLGPAEQRLYRLCGLHPGEDFDAHAAAALMGVPERDAAHLLDALFEESLFEEPRPGRFTFHDLVRTHAAMTAERVDPRSELRDALTRLIEYYARSASIAAVTAYPDERGNGIEVPPGAAPLPPLTDRPLALGWLDAETPNLLASVRCATQQERPRLVMLLSHVLHRHLTARALFDAAATVHEHALSAATDTGDRTGVMQALIDLSDVQRYQGHYPEATRSLQQALDIARETGHRTGELDAVLGLADTARIIGPSDAPRRQYAHALELARAIGHRAGELTALVGLGRIHRMHDSYEQAAAHFAAARDIARDIGHDRGLVQAMLGLGWANWLLGAPDRAVEHFEAALEAANAIGSRPGLLSASIGLGEAHRARGRYAAAARYCEQARDIARATGQATGEVSALIALGHAQRAQREYESAADGYERALVIARKSADRNGEYEALQGRGRVHAALGRADEALACHRDALTIASELGQPADEARAHDGLAHAHRALGRHDQARQHWRRALDILTGLGVTRSEDAEATTSAIESHLEALAEPAR